MENQTLDQPKITSIQNDYMKAQMKEAKNMQMKMVYRRRRLGLLFFVATCVFGFMGFNLFHSFSKMHQLNLNAKEVRQEQKATKTAQKDLEMQVNLLKDDDYVAKLARQKYYLSKDGETIYRYPNSEKEE